MTVFLPSENKEFWERKNKYSLLDETLVNVGISQRKVWGDTTI